MGSVLFRKVDLGSRCFVFRVWVFITSCHLFPTGLSRQPFPLLLSVPSFSTLLLSWVCLYCDGFDQVLFSSETFYLSCWQWYLQGGCAPATGAQLGNGVFPHTQRNKLVAHDGDPLCLPEGKVPGVRLTLCGCGLGW